ncbi:MAG: hypothetical protein K0Q95_1186 [Bacteroidota bacterium]|jgi:hypothetical protein|nr:hypothetical protein [Bacteroidota bacterium]
MKEVKPKNKTMETLLLKMMLSWAIMIIGFVALFAGCNNPKVENHAASATADSTIDTPPDNTRTDGIKDKDPVTDTAQ